MLSNMHWINKLSSHADAWLLSGHSCKSVPCKKRWDARFLRPFRKKAVFRIQLLRSKFYLWTQKDTAGDIVQFIIGQLAGFGMEQLKVHFGVFLGQLDLVFLCEHQKFFDGCSLFCFCNEFVVHFHDDSSLKLYRMFLWNCLQYTSGVRAVFNALFRERCLISDGRQARQKSRSFRSIPRICRLR